MAWRSCNKPGEKLPNAESADSSADGFGGVVGERIRRVVERALNLRVIG